LPADIIINITRQAGGITQAGFGKPFILATDKDLAYAEYASISEVAVDYAVSTIAYKIAAALFSQEFQPPLIAIQGKLFTEDTAVDDESLSDSGDQTTWEFANGNIKVDSIIDLQDNSVPIVAGDIASIDYVAGTITFTGTKVGPITADYSYHNDTTELVTELNTIVNANDDWYFLLCDLANYVVQDAFETWISTQTKEYFTRTDILPSVYPASLLSERLPMYYHATADEFLDGAIVGQGGPKDPGSLTWKNQRLNGITPNELSTSDFNAIRAARWNTFINSYGVGVTSDGLMTNTLFIDQRRSQDFIKIRMEEAIASLLINNDKVAYDDIGIAQIVGALESVLNLAGAQGIIARKPDGKTFEFIVNFLTRAQIFATDPQAIADRILRSVTFQYVEAGAIESAVVNGVVVGEL